MAVYKAGKFETRSLRLGDQVVDNNDNVVDGVVLHSGYAIPNYTNSKIRGFDIHKVSFDGDKMKISLDDDEIIALYKEMKKLKKRIEM